MLKIHIVLSFLLIMAPFERVMSANESTEYYRYTSPFPRSTIALDIGKSQIVIDDHSILGGTVCPLSSAFQCFSGPNSLFVFPRRKVSVQSSWEFGGQKFNVQRKMTGQILGRQYSAFLVKSQVNDDNYWYLYSPIDGLLAFGLANKSETSTFILEGRCGFASKRNCR